MMTNILGNEGYAIYDDLDQRADVVEEGNYNEGHYYATLRDFEELIAEYGAKRVLSDMDDDILADILEYERD